MSFSKRYGLPAQEQLDRLIDLALDEDVGDGDVTSHALIPANKTAEFSFRAREDLVMAGLFLVPKVYAKLALRTDGLLPPQTTAHCEDGTSINQGETMITVSGNAHLLLTGERLALNLLQRLCGVATLTARYVKEVEGTHCAILDTRKTMPGMRYLDKYAVTCGGGQNHRLRLDDAILIKDNHLTVQPDIGAAIQTARAKYSDLKIEVECDTLEQVAEALIAKPDWILLDNMPPSMLEQAVEMAEDSGVKLEASGGITLETVKVKAKTGVDAISIGALTHSAVAVDIGLDRVIN